MADTDFSQQILEELILAVSATAVIVMRINDPATKITAGALSQSGFHDLGKALVRYWPESLGQNVNRYAGLSFDGYFQKLFVKRLSDGQHWLGLLFPQSTSFQRIRQDMMIFIESLQGKNSLGSDFDQRLEYFLQHTDQLTPGLRQENPSGQGQAGWIRINKMIEESEDTQVPEKMIHIQENIAKEVYQAPQTPKSINTIVEDVANAHSLDDDWTDVDVIRDEISWKTNDYWWSRAVESAQEEKTRSKSHETLPDEDSPLQEGKIDAVQTAHETSQYSEDLVSIFQEDFELRDAMAGFNEWVKPQEVDDEQAAPDSGGGLEQMTSLADVDEVSAPTKDVVSDITFCLVPYMDEHFLLEKLAENLRSWFPVICDQYSWELEWLSVRPKSLKWTLCDFPESLIGDMFQIIHQKTSERIFQVFPELQEGNPSGDFWEPGYFVNSQESQVVI